MEATKIILGIIRTVLLVWIIYEIIGVKIHQIDERLMVYQAKWAYQIVTPRDSAFESTMIGEGKEGWELVTARRATGGSGAKYECIMKKRY